MDRRHAIQRRVMRGVYAHALLGLALGVTSCGRAAVDSDSTPKHAGSSSVDPAVAAAPVWSVAEFSKHREIATDSLVSITGVLKGFDLYHPCPKDFTCAPGGSTHVLADSMDATQEQSVAFTGELEEGGATFEVGKRYVFTGKSPQWSSERLPLGVMAQLQYVAHRAAE